MSDINSNSIQRMLKGSLAVFIGNLLSLFLGFITKVLFVRFTTQEEYGIFALALTIATIVLTISTLGFENGISRYIAYLKGKNDVLGMEKIISYSIIIGLLVSIIFSLIAYEFTFIATSIFDTDKIVSPLKIILISVPFFTLSKIFVSIYRGFGIIKVKMYFSDILRPLLYFLLIGLAVATHSSFHSMIYAYVLSVVVTFFVILGFYTKRSPLKISKINKIDHCLLKNFMWFSLPLLVINILLTVMSWTDTLMIGYFKEPALVGEYNTVYPTASLLSLVINSIAFLYVPNVSEYYGKNDTNSIKEMNSTFTKWCFILTLPLFSLIFLFPEMLIELLFGARYLSAAPALQVLSLGFLFNSLFGFNYHTLLTIGKSKFLMYCSLLSAMMNIILNILLIPKLGVLGASIASATSFILIELLMTSQLNKMTGIHPFTKSYSKIILISILSIAIGYYIKLNVATSYLTAVFLFVGLAFIFVLITIVTKALDETDMSLINSLSSKVQKLYGHNK